MVFVNTIPDDSKDRRGPEDFGLNIGLMSWKTPDLMKLTKKYISVNFLVNTIRIETMQNTIEIKHLSREEKLKMIDALWADLVSEEEFLESPEWHKKVLQETEQRFAEGKEKILNWQTAKKKLRKHFE
jgi:hypothetical protein